MSISLAEKNAAMREVYQVMKCYGTQFDLLIADESTIVRDKYGSIIQRPNTKIQLYAFPMLFNPTRKDLEKAGIAENVEAVFYLSKLELNNNAIDFNKIDMIKQRVVYNSVEYTIKEKALISQFANDFLYVTLGLKRK